MNILNYREKDFRGDTKAPGLSAVSAGWQSLSHPGKWLFTLSVALLTGAFLFSQWERQHPLMLGFYLLALLFAAGNYLRARVLPQLMARSLLADLTIKDGQINIAEFCLLPRICAKTGAGKTEQKRAGVFTISLERRPIVAISVS